MPHIRACTIIVLAVLVFLGMGRPVSYGAEFDQTSASQAIVVDYDTGMTLFEKNADEKMPTSSMSKIMTMYLVFEALESGRLTLDAKLPVSEKAWRMGGSKMFVGVGDRVKVEDLIRGVLVQSGNDATVVLAEGLAGSEDSFADAINAKAKQLGMTNSHFMNASGWPDPDHYSTARDLAVMTAAFIRDFPQYYPYCAEKSFTYNNIRQDNRNPLLYRNIGADGVKTGHTEDGGYGLIASGERGGRRVVVVLNGLPDGRARADEGDRLLDWGLRGFENVGLYSAGETVVNGTVVMGKEKDVPLATGRDIKVTIPVTLKNDLKVEAVYDGPVRAPVKKGDRIGVLRVAVPRSETLEFPLFAAKDVERLGIFGGMIAKAGILLGKDGG